MRDDIKRIERLRPKGYDKKVWLALYREAEDDKAEAIVQAQSGTYAKECSTMSLQYLGERLYKNAAELAKGSYDYLKMRAFGETFIGALDLTARRRWEELSGKKVSLKKTWKYDHTVGHVSAKAEANGWKLGY